MRYRDIPQFTRHAGYHVNMFWDYLPGKIAEFQQQDGLTMEPEFQRAHVWTEEQSRRYVEYVLRGGLSGKAIFFNHPGWNSRYEGQMVIVDGKQRLMAVLAFVGNQYPIFDGYYCRDFTDRMPMNANFDVYINDLQTNREVLQWYLDLNTGHIAHTADEIEKVRRMLEAEQS